jgi:multiple sugar transport system permease protein
VVAAGCIGLAVGLPAAYSIARWRQQQLAVVILVARIIPSLPFRGTSSFAISDGGHLAR